MISNNLSTLNHEEWIIANFRVDDAQQVNNLANLFKNRKEELNKKVKGWYFNCYYNQNEENVSDRYHFKIFLWRNSETTKEELKKLVTELPKDVMGTIKNRYMPNPDFDSECILEYSYLFS